MLCHEKMNQCSFPRRKGIGSRNVKNMASAGARAYNGGLGALLPAGSRGRAPGQGDKPPEAESILTLKRANSALSLKSNASSLEQSTPVNKRRI